MNDSITKELYELLQKCIPPFSHCTFVSATKDNGNNKTACPWTLIDKMGLIFLYTILILLQGRKQYM